MNQEEIGKFIAKMRKEKNLTQLDLANYLNVSINAVSKWERGICLMDMALLKPLCAKLDISVNELLSARKLDENNYQKVSEDVIFNIVKEREKYKKIYKIYLTILIIVTLLVIFFLIGFKYGKIYEKEVYISAEFTNIQNSYLKEYYQDSNSILYYYGIDDIKINEDMSLKDYLQKRGKNIWNGIDELLKHAKITKRDNLEDGTTINYINDVAITKCSNQDVFITSSNNLPKGMCGNELSKTYYVNKIKKDKDGCYELELSWDIGEEKELVKIRSKENLEENKFYEFVFLANDNNFQSIKEVFNKASLLEIKEVFNVIAV